MTVTKLVRIDDASARANVIDALSGRGAPRGVIAVEEDGSTIRVSFDADVTQPELIDDLIAIESVFVARLPAEEMTLERAAALAAAGLSDPQFDVSRIIETRIAARR